MSWRWFIRYIVLARILSRLQSQDVYWLQVQQQQDLVVLRDKGLGAR